MIWLFLVEKKLRWVGSRSRNNGHQVKDILKNDSLSHHLSNYYFNLFQLQGSSYYFINKNLTYIMRVLARNTGKPCHRIHKWFMQSNFGVRPLLWTKVAKWRNDNLGRRTLVYVVMVLVWEQIYLLTKQWLIQTRVVKRNLNELIMFNF